MIDGTRNDSATMMSVISIGTKEGPDADGDRRPLRPTWDGAAHNGPGKPPAQPARATVPRCRSVSSRKPIPSPASPDGRKPKSRPGWKQTGNLCKEAGDITLASKTVFDARSLGEPTAG